MSIKAYVGRMGSGKTYEVVSVVLLNALRLGRRVVTNIAGIDYKAMADLLVSQGVDPDAVGKIVLVSHERVADADFWLTESVNVELKEKGFNDAELRILPGDLIALDEIWRFWSGFALKDGEGKKRPESVMNFMRMHRHFTHADTGVACDLAIITQDVMDISRQVRAVIEETYRMEKLTAIGSTKRYRVDVCQGGQSRKVLRAIQREYDPKYFGLYSSHSGRKEGDAQAKEVNIDQRGNILQGALFKFVLPVAAIVFVFAVYTVWQFFHPKDKDAKVSTTTAKQDPKQGKVDTVSHAKPQQEESSSWRVVGWINTDRMRVVLTDGQTQRIIEPPNWKLNGSTVETFLPNGEAVTSWTGRARPGIIDQAAGHK